MSQAVVGFLTLANLSFWEKVAEGERRIPLDSVTPFAAACAAAAAGWGQGSIFQADKLAPHFFAQRAARFG